MELALALAPAIGTNHLITEACESICRLAKQHHRIQENDCNGYATWDHKWDQEAADRAEKREARLEARITAVVVELKTIDGERLGVHFQGDPRGATVKITLPEKWRHLYDSWGGDGVCVPQR
jgi:hypothetical protein